MIGEPARVLVSRLCFYRRPKGCFFDAGVGLPLLLVIQSFLDFFLERLTALYKVIDAIFLSLFVFGVESVWNVSLALFLGVDGFYYNGSLNFETVFAQWVAALVWKFMPPFDKVHRYLLLKCKSYIVY